MHHAPRISRPAFRGSARPGAAQRGWSPAAYGNGLAALKGFADDPVGRLPATSAALGLAYGVASVLCFLLGGDLMFPFKDGLFDFLGFGGY